MSSTCNIVGCKNDVRYKERMITMPHVPVLRFHAPRHEHMEQWQARINVGRDNTKKCYTVSKSTRVCSNHFKGGRYCKDTCAVPTVYLGKYPNWAKSSMDLRKAAAVLDDAITCQVLSHIIQHLSKRDRLAICRYIPGSTVKNVLVNVRDMCKETARDILCQVTNKLYPIGKLQEAIAIFKGGIEFDSVGFQRKNTALDEGERGVSFSLSTPRSGAEDALETEQNTLAVSNVSTNSISERHTEKVPCALADHIYHRSQQGEKKSQTQTDAIDNKHSEDSTEEEPVISDYGSVTDEDATNTTTTTITTTSKDKTPKNDGDSPITMEQAIGVIQSCHDLDIQEESPMDIEQTNGMFLCDREVKEEVTDSEQDELRIGENRDNHNTDQDQDLDIKQEKTTTDDQLPLPCLECQKTLHHLAEHLQWVHNYTCSQAEQAQAEMYAQTIRNLQLYTIIKKSDLVSHMNGPSIGLEQLVQILEHYGHIVVDPPEPEPQQSPKREPEDDITEGSVEDISNHSESIGGLDNTQVECLPEEISTPVTSETAKKAFACDLCTKSFKSRLGLRDHKNRHAQKYRYNCPVCKRGFMGRSQFNSHKLQHLQMKGFKCDLCEKAFMHRKDLNAHVKAKHEDTIYMCQNCDKMYTSSYSLAKHEQMCVRGKVFKCSKCSYQSNFGSNLNRHMKRSH